MKKQILNIGKALKKGEQKQINGGGPGPITSCAPGSGIYIASEDHVNCCAYPDSSGGVCYGSIVNNSYCSYVPSVLDCINF